MNEVIVLFETAQNRQESITEELHIVKKSTEDKIIALAGNPNVGKSTVFNSLTGMNQHTGNWPGKTVTNAQGEYIHKNKRFVMVDIPGTYSLMASSVEEEVARDFICFGGPDVTVVVTDATCLERNLNLVLQSIELAEKVVVCVNLMDEAKKKKIHIDLEELSHKLGVPVVGASARARKGIDELMEQVYQLAFDYTKINPYKVVYSNDIEEAITILQPAIESVAGKVVNSRWLSLRLLDVDESLYKSVTEHLGVDLLENELIKERQAKALELLHNRGISSQQLRDNIVSQLVQDSEKIFQSCVSFEKSGYNDRDRKIDKILTSRATGIPVMLLLLGIVFWITITGANYPSQALSNLFGWVEGHLTSFFTWLGTPAWVHGVLVLGIYKTLAWVISVMLPPMAIFFPLFTLLEDSGYLPRIAFNMDRFFKKAHAHGKQALTMCMGFGCNACGVIGCRIIDSPRERLIATLTNNFVPCNGRFPTLIAIIAMFFTGMFTPGIQSITQALLLMAVIVLGVAITLFISKFLSKTVLKGLPSSFALELPPYRRPQIGKVIIRSIFDRTLFVLGRAVVVAAPAGLIIWLLANVNVGDASLLAHCTGFLDPFAKLFGLDGVILMAFILGFPANEIVIPIIIMSYMATGNMLDFESLTQLKQLLLDNGWTWITAVCTMLFSLLHFPCATTCLTIKKETQSLKWTALSIVLPTAVGLLVCFLVAQISNLVMAIL